MTYLRAPHKPQFEDVVVSSALNHLVAGVVAHVIVLVLLEQVVRAHLVCLDEQALGTEVSGSTEPNGFLTSSFR